MGILVPERYGQEQIRPGVDVHRYLMNSRAAVICPVELTKIDASSLF